LLECPFNVARHGDVHSVHVIIPCQGHATIMAGCPVLSDLVVLIQGIQEMLHISLGSVPDGKVVNNYHEMYVMGGMHP